jgi:hypothetical protein
VSEPIITPTITLESLTNGRFKSAEEIEALAAEAERLKSTPTYKTDFAKNIDEFVANGGDPYDFVKYSKITTEGLSDVDVAILHKKLTTKVPMTDDQIKRLVTNKYKQVEDPEFHGFNEDDILIGADELANDAPRLRAEIEAMKQKATYVAPKQEEQLAQQIDPKVAEENERTARELQAAYDNFKGHELAINEGEISAKVNLPVADSEFLKQVSSDPTAIFSKFIGADGKVDYNKFLRVANYAANPDAYEAIIAKTAFSQGQEKFLAKINNPSEIQPTKGELTQQAPTKEDFQRVFYRS